MLYLSLISKTIERSVHFQGKPFNTTVIQVYATTTVAKGADIDQRQNTDFGTINLMRGVQAYMSIFLSLDTSSSHNCPMQHFSLAIPQLTVSSAHLVFPPPPFSVSEYIGSLNPVFIEFPLCPVSRTLCCCQCPT